MTPTQTTHQTIFDAAGRAAPAKALASAFGVDPAKAQTALDIMSQALADRVERNTLSRGGIADLFDVMSRPGAGVALKEPSSALTSPEVADVGNSILEVLVGSKHGSRGIAAKAARASGIDTETLKKMLPAVASMVIGAAQAKAAPQLEKSIAGLPVALKGSPLSLPGDTMPAGRAAGNGGSPLPLPGDNIPGLDAEGPSRFPQLPDVIRRQGREVQVPSPEGGQGSLDEVIRQILANVFGFKNTGILGFILKIIFSRWFMGLLSRILFRR